MEYLEEEIRSMWYDFFSHTDYGTRLSEIADEYPDTRSLYVQFEDLENYNPSVAEDFLKNPDVYLREGEKAIREYLHDPNLKIHLRINQLPRDRKREIRELRAVHIGQFLSIEGIIRRASEVRPKLKVGAFRCSDCGGITEVEQEGAKLQEPFACSQCNKTKPKVKFKLIIEKSTFVDTQRAEIQDNPENLRGREQPQRLMAYLEDDIAGEIVPGDRVVLNGILRTVERRLGNVRTTDFDIYLDVVSIDKESKELESIEITEEDEIRIREEARNGDIIERMKRAIAPTIYGMDIEKEALLLQMFGGVTKRMKDGTRIRGDIHILLVGDPGTAKSQLLQYMAQLAPRGIYTSGKGSSAAGLTATAVRDETGRWTLEAGALVLADLGLAAIDEIDKMNPTDRDSIYQAMEQQIIAVTKAGIYATLMARCSILGAANPKYGRFDISKPIVEQIDLPTPLLSRFDVIFKIIDKPNAERDRALANHILEAHLAGEMLELEEEDNIVVKQFDVGMSPDFIRKYVAYAKRNVVPKMSDEAKKLILDKYVNTRKQFEETRAVPITPRQLEAMIRLAEASARARLSDIVTREDAERAIKIIDYFLKEASSEEGIIDADLLYSGISSRQRSVMERMEDIIRALARDNNGMAEEKAIIAQAVADGIEESRARNILRKMHQQGIIVQQREGVYRYVSP
ncbi:putative ATPase involved in replication control, Cdc46/Mcm family [Aciduliprofundum sp. MAR08-339]|uniref:minichromosome maintenance protein MCM n=1 Tax=Aciduliprofundum sp. (strain MAR08-339) TaxID=673860 RepID=UPI0002A4C94E|nr:putative ATPase involved in replication control, Cdc46/Mcm family [Aciduliprofundum sp. MAR08-339]